MISVITEWLLLIDNLLAPERCQEIISKTEANLKKSSLLGQHIHEYRTSYDFFYDKHSAEDELFNNMVTKLIGTDSRQHEGLSIVRYQEGQQYKEHYDFLFQIEDELKRGGDRIFTFLMYLNDDFQGGETYFPKLDIAIEPKAGRAVIWKNYIDDLPNYESLHCGLPVINGEKWIATKWVRQSEFK